MASVVLLTTILIVVATFVNSQRSLLHYPLKKSVPLQLWEDDKEKLNRHLEQDARGPQVRPGPRLPPLLTQHTPDQWQAPERAIHTDESRKKVRVNLLKSKLMPQVSQQRKIVAHRKAFPKPDTNTYQRHKRDVDQTETKEERGAVRKKRQVIMNAQPEMVMQPHIQPALPQDKETKYQEKVSEKRDKRQIIYLINQRPLFFAKKPRKTTPNPFNREADIADYEIVRPTPEGLVPAAVETDEDIDTGSYLLSETSELEYESDYTISMSDVEDWENYPLTTPSGPNPGWRLSTLADIYQRPRRNRVPIRVEQVQVLTRMKRSPKEKKRKIGLYKERLKQRRKRKDMRRKRRIITKEDKIRMKAEESMKKDEEVVEDLLQRPRIRQRKTTYGEDVSREILWSNDTHRIVEDPGATVKWINKTHYQIFKENATDDWYNEDHILMYGEEYLKNKTTSEKESESEEQIDEEDEEYVEDYDEEFTREEEEEKGIIAKKGKKINDQDIKKIKKPNIEKEKEEEIIEKTQTDDTDKEEEQEEQKLSEKTTLKRKSKENEQNNKNGEKISKDTRMPKTNVRKDNKKPNKKDIKKKKEKKSGSDGESSGLGWEDQIDKGSDEEKFEMESLGILSDEAILESDSSEDKKKVSKKKSGKKGKQKTQKKKP